MRVQDLISAYRHRGHKRAYRPWADGKAITPSGVGYHRLSPADLDETFNTGTFHYGDGTAKLRDIETALQQTCGSIGAEYMHIVDAAEQLWVQQRLESTQSA